MPSNTDGENLSKENWFSDTNTLKCGDCLEARKVLATSLYSFSVQYLHRAYNKKLFILEQGFNANKQIYGYMVITSDILV